MRQAGRPQSVAALRRVREVGAQFPDDRGPRLGCPRRAPQPPRARNAYAVIRAPAQVKRSTLAC